MSQYLTWNQNDTGSTSVTLSAPFAPLYTQEDVDRLIGNLQKERTNIEEEYNMLRMDFAVLKTKVLTEKETDYYCPEVRKIIESRNKRTGQLTTCVLWEDGTKTLVKCMEGELENREAAFCAALAKKIYGSKVKRIIKDNFVD